MTIAFFDFDHTITTRDSFLDIIAYKKGRKALYRGIAIHLLAAIGYKLGWVSGGTMKEKFLKYYFKGMSIEEFRNMSECYAKERLPQILNAKALQVIADHIEKDHDVAIVSASLDLWIKPWAKDLGIDVIATQLEVVNNKITGKLKGANCIGKEKTIRIKQQYDLKKYNDIYAYGDSKGDKEMLGIANYPKYRAF